MATRTIQFLGMGVGSNPVTVTVTANGTQFFNGTIPTVNQPIPVLPNPELIPDQTVIITLELDTAFAGQVPMTFTVSGGAAIFGEVMTNYWPIRNPVYTDEEWATITNDQISNTIKAPIFAAHCTPPLTQEQYDIVASDSTPWQDRFAILDSHGAARAISGGPNQFFPLGGADPRANVTINGVDQIEDHTDLGGQWWWTLTSGSVMACDLEVAPARV